MVGRNQQHDNNYLLFQFSQRHPSWLAHNPVEEMVRTILLLALLLAAPLFGQSWDSTSGTWNAPAWEKHDKVLLATYLAGAVIDYGQSRYILDHPAKFHESVPFINDKQELTLAMLGIVGTTVTVAHFCPKWRTRILGTMATVQWCLVGHNAGIGVSFGW
jgi:hypothetical protein